MLHVFFFSAVSIINISVTEIPFIFYENNWHSCTIVALILLMSLFSVTARYPDILYGTFVIFTTNRACLHIPADYVLLKQLF